MSKKTFAAAPKPKQPTDDQILAFERGGTGHDTKQTVKLASKPKEQERTKRLSLDLPETLHRRFKTACSATSRKMVAELQAFIEARTAELEVEAKQNHK